MARVHVKKGDKVVVISGAWKSNEPKEVLKTDLEKDTVIVQGVNMRWKHERRSQKNPQGARIQKEFPINSSKVQLFSENQKKGVRTRIEVVDGKKIRVGIPCGTHFD